MRAKPTLTFPVLKYCGKGAEKAEACYLLDWSAWEASIQWPKDHPPFLPELFELVLKNTDYLCNPYDFKVINHYIDLAEQEFRISSSSQILLNLIQTIFSRLASCSTAKVPVQDEVVLCALLLRWNCELRWDRFDIFYDILKPAFLKKTDELDAPYGLEKSSPKYDIVLLAPYKEAIETHLMYWAKCWSDDLIKYSTRDRHDFIYVSDPTIIPTTIVDSLSKPHVAIVETKKTPPKKLPTKKLMSKKIAAKKTVSKKTLAKKHRGFR